jgi:ribosomal protein S18 acetylase RimI-like enzyme
MPPALQIRPATPGDAAAIAEVHVRSWQAAYAGIVDAAHLAGLSIERRTQGWAGELTAGRTHVRVATLDDRLVAFVSHGDCRDPGAAPDVGEVWCLYARPDAWGAGAGRALMDAALADLAQAGKSACTLWVLADNARARRFYEHAGFAPVPGAVETVEVAGQRLQELRYRRPLAPFPSPHTQPPGPPA